MDKTQSQIYKGIAILMMLFTHLFNRMENVDLCSNHIFIGDCPAVYILSRACYAVAFFLILGGYGLYKVYTNGDRHRWTRIIKLFIHYWMTLLIFVSIGHFVNPELYPGPLRIILYNISGYGTSYNREMWFLLPYAILSILSPFIFKYTREIKGYLLVGGSLVIYLGTSFTISRFLNPFIYQHYWIYPPLLVCHLLFNFMLGAVAARDGWFEKLKTRFHAVRPMWVYSFMILLVIIQCSFKYNFFYAFLIICCLNLVRIDGPVRRILTKLGDQSMNMWMIHTWYCYYLLHDFIYSFTFPILIFLVLTLLSYYSGKALDILVKPIESIFMTKKEIKEPPIL